jgi:hypothetical protein
VSKGIKTGLIVAGAVVAVVLVARALSASDAQPAVAAKVGPSSLGWPSLSPIWARAARASYLSAALGLSASRSVVP